MRHRIAGRKLGRNTNQRKSLFKNLLRSLILTGQIETTLAKAKTLRSLADKMMTLAKNGSLAARRRAVAVLSDREVTEKLFKTLAPQAQKRNSGYTRIRRIGRRRGDNSLMVRLEWVDRPIAAEKAAK